MLTVLLTPSSQFLTASLSRALAPGHEMCFLLETKPVKERENETKVIASERFSYKAENAILEKIALSEPAIALPQRNLLFLGPKRFAQISELKVK